MITSSYIRRLFITSFDRQRVLHNKESVDFYLQASGSVSKIASTLKQIGINYFWYNRYYYDGKVLNISNSQLFLTKTLLEYDCLDYADIWISVNKNMKVGDNLKLLHPTEHKDYYELSNLFKVHNPFNIFYKTKDYIELIGFACDKPQFQAVNLYFNYLPVLEKFAAKFKKEAKIIIKQAENNLIILPKRTFDIDYQLSVPKVGSINENNILTKREQECLSVLSKGMSYKEISSNLFISQRTVEEHINNIKSKTGLNSRSQLIKFYNEETW